MSAILPTRRKAMKTTRVDHIAGFFEGYLDVDGTSSVVEVVPDTGLPGTGAGASS
jgi:hypothetical protein